MNKTFTTAFMAAIAHRETVESVKDLSFIGHKLTPWNQSFYPWMMFNVLKSVW